MADLLEGQDTTSTQLLDALYQQEPLTESQLKRLISLFLLDFLDPQDALPEMAGKPV